MPLPVVEQLLRSGIRMLNLGHVQKRLLGQIKLKLFVKASRWTREFSQKLRPELVALAFQDLRPCQSHGEAMTLAWPEILESRSRRLRPWLLREFSGPSGGFDKQFYKFNLAQKPFLDMSKLNILMPLCNNRSTTGKGNH